MFNLCCPFLQAAVESSAFASRTARLPEAAEAEGDALDLDAAARDALACSARATRAGAPGFAVHRAVGQWRGGAAAGGCAAASPRHLDYDSDEEVHAGSAGFGARKAARRASSFGGLRLLSACCGAGA